MKKQFEASKDRLFRSAQQATNQAKQAAAGAKSRLSSTGANAAKSKQTIKTYSNLVGRGAAKRQDRTRRKAEYLAQLPKSRAKRLFYRLNPRRAMAYWFSREGGIMALKVAGIAAAVFIVLTIGLFAYFRKDLPNPREIRSRLLNQTTKFYDRTGKVLLYEVYGEQNRTIIEFDQISKHMKNATVAVEDKDFYHHNGFSLSGIIRAAINNALNKTGGTQGGSTITQQFIKNSLLSDERTITRKLKELILAIELERLYEKDEILAFYLNEIPYGSLEYGVQAAAQSFFKKDAKHLTLDESAMIAALPQAPSYYSPYGANTEELTQRKAVVLNLMRDQGYITKEEAEAAKKVDTLAKLVPIEQKSLYANMKAPHFVLEAQRQLEEEFGPTVVQTGGLRVITSLDLKLQDEAEKAVRENMKTVEAYNGDNTALSATDVQTGQVVAQVGSRDFNYPGYGSYNAAVSGRQPGSSFKPYAYAELFKNDRWGPDSIIYDTPTDFFGYKPKNFDFKYRGMMKVREAVGESRNIPAVKALYIAGVDNVVGLARKMGNKSIGDPDTFGLSVVLGAGEVKLAEHVHAYSTFARGGVYKEQTYVIEVKNGDGEVIKKWQDTKGKRVLDEQIAYLITDVLKDDVARSRTFGRNNKDLVVPGVTTAVKTGTTDLSRDGWMMGYSRKYAVGVWVGNHDNKPMNSITSRQTGPIWTQFVKAAHKDVKDRPIFDKEPKGIQKISMNRSTGYAATSGGFIGLFPSWYKKQLPRSGAQNVTIDRVSNKIATECTPELAKISGSASGKWPEILPSDPAFKLWAPSAGYSASGAALGGSSERDDVHKCSDIKPSISFDILDAGGNTYTLRATVTQGTHALKTLNFKVNGQIVSSQNVTASGTYDYSYTNAAGGTFEASGQIIDVLYYDASASASEGGGIALLSPSPGASLNGSVSFSWSDTGASGYEVCWVKISNGMMACEDENDTSYTAPSSRFLSLGGSGAYRAFVTPDGGSQSPDVNFSWSP